VKKPISRRCDDRKCAVCGDPVGATAWVLLNRYAIGTGENSGLVEGKNESGECIWEIGPDFPQDTATGQILHYPGCLSAFLDAKILEIDFRVRRGTF
jgi:hypothetical protein